MVILLLTRDMLMLCGCPLARLRWSTSIANGPFRPPRLYCTCSDPEDMQGDALKPGPVVRNNFPLLYDDLIMSSHQKNTV